LSATYFAGDIKMDIKKIFENPRRNAVLAMLPHMDIQNQKKMAMMIKLMEIKDILNYYENIDERAISSQNICKKTLVADLMPHMNQDAQKSMQGMLQVLEMQELLSNS